MNEVKEINKQRVRRTVRKDSRLTAIGVWTLVIIEAVRYGLPYVEVFI